MEETYVLPEDRIALYPANPRDSCRLMVVKLPSMTVEDVVFSQIGHYFLRGDVITVNNSRVMHARIRGFKDTGARVEFLLLEEKEKGVWRALGKPASRLRKGMKISIVSASGKQCTLHIEDKYARGIFTVSAPADILEYGVVPLPPYIASRRRECDNDIDDYQTNFALKDGSVASPTSALHFTRELVESIKSKGVQFAEVTLHVGPGTFRTTYDRPESEKYSISGTAADCLNNASRICVCGTTVMRTLETGYHSGKYIPGSGSSDIYIKPGHAFSPVNMFITNFHMSGTPLIKLVAAYLDGFYKNEGMDKILKLYKRALDKGYMFLSYGDAMMFIDERV